MISSTAAQVSTLFLQLPPVSGCPSLVVLLAAAHRVPMFREFKEKHASKFGFASSDAPSEDAQARDRGQDLTTILDRSQRGDLTILLAQITDSMREAIKSDFKAPKSREQQGAELKQKDVDYVVKDRKLATSTLLFFDEWRDSVLLRIGEAVNKDEENFDASPQDVQSEELPLELDERSIEKLHKVYEPQETPLIELPEAKKLLILHSLLLLLLGLEHYNSLSRVLMLRVLSSLGLDLRILNEDEVQVARGLLDTAIQLSSDTGGAPEQGKKVDNSRKWKVGIASVAGAVLVGVTGGLAAPLVAAGLGTVFGGLGLASTAAATYLGALAGSGVVVGGLFGAYGGSMTGRMVDKYAREVDDFAFIPVRGSWRRPRDEREAARGDHRLRVTVGISGYVTEVEDYIDPWRVIGADSEVFGLRWEYKPLKRLGNAITSMVTSAAWSAASGQILSETIFAQIMNAVFLPLGLLKVASVADNPFSVAKSRADKAGEVLADALISKVQGQRAVNLIGYSLGSRVIFSCLQSLSKRGGYGLVESAIVMGSPIPSSTDQWRRIRSVVSGRVVNVFSKNDSVLALLYRTSSFQLGVAGLQPVEGLPGVENVDMSELVSGHMRYQYLVGRILTTIGLESVDAREMAREEEELSSQDRRQEQERLRNERMAGVEGDEEGVRRSLETGEDVGEGGRLGKQVQGTIRTDEAPRSFDDMGLQKGAVTSERAPYRDPYDSDKSWSP